VVPPPQPPDPEPAPDGPLAQWRRQLRTIVSVSHGGLIVGLNGTHWGAARPLLEELQDEDAQLHVSTDPRTLMTVPSGSRVVLLEYADELTWLNLHRPIVRERKLQLFLWAFDAHVSAIRAQAPDFLDWVSHRIEVPPFAPRFAVTQATEAMRSKQLVALFCDSSNEELLVRAVGAMTVRTLDYQALVSSLRSPEPVWLTASHEVDVWKLLIAWTEAGSNQPVLLLNPPVVPFDAATVDGRPVPWPEAEAVGSDRSESLIRAARLDLDPSVVTLANTPVPASPPPMPPPGAVQYALDTIQSSDRRAAAKRLFDEVPQLHEVSLAWSRRQPEEDGVRTWAEALQLRARRLTVANLTREERREALAAIDTRPELEDSSLEDDTVVATAKALEAYGFAARNAGDHAQAQVAFSRTYACLLPLEVSRHWLFRVLFFHADCDRVRGRYVAALDGYRRANEALERDFEIEDVLFGGLREAEMLYLLDRLPEANTLADRIRDAAYDLLETLGSRSENDLALDANEQILQALFSQLGDLYIRLRRARAAVRSWLHGTGSRRVDEVEPRHFALLDAVFQRRGAVGETSPQHSHRFGAYADWNWRAAWATSLAAVFLGPWDAQRHRPTLAPQRMRRSFDALRRLAAEEPERADWTDLAAASALQAAKWLPKPDGRSLRSLAASLWSKLDASGALPPARRLDFEALGSSA